MPDDEVDAHLHGQGVRTCERYQADWAPWLARRRRRGRRPAPISLGRPPGVVGATAGPGAHAVPRPSAPARCCGSATSTCSIDFPAGEVRAVGRRAVRVLVHDRPTAGRAVVAERAVDWSNALFLSLPLPGLAGRGVQRVPLQLLQVAVEPSAWSGPRPRPGQKHRAVDDDSEVEEIAARRLDRGALLPPPPGRPGHLRRGSTVACSPARCTAGSSTCRPAAASPPTIDRSGRVQPPAERRGRPAAGLAG